MTKPTLLLLPPKKGFETPEVLKKLITTHRYLAELKGIVTSIPSQALLLNTLPLQEAKHSSEIENIVTTHDELYKTTLFKNPIKNPAAKEVSHYAVALREGFRLVSEQNILTINHILEIHKILENNDAGIRKLPGTELKNDQTGQTIYKPPQDYQEILNLMANLVAFINDDELYDADPLIKMAIIHLQFEWIHPFYDGNGRTGRIINVLYLVTKKLLDLPILYLSRYIIANKAQYYALLQNSRNCDDWVVWIIYMLNAIEQTALHTISLVQEIKTVILDYKHRIRSQLPKLYSQDLINNLFNNPYTKIELIQNDLNVSRATATKYLYQLTQAGFLEKHKEGRHNYYINTPLVALLFRD